MKQNHQIDVGYVAKLACLSLSDTEKELFQEQLDQVLGYIDQLNEVNVQGVEPMYPQVTSVNELRSDYVGSAGFHENIKHNFPAQVKDQVRVPKIIDS
jgi:aspartyl-tRNA(Asn)/glutamyl-tRNA(Gln) amidotransferase subunit C